MKKYLSKWYIYLLTVIVTVVAFCLGVTFKTNPKATEKVNFFLGTYDALTSKLDEALEKNKKPSIKKVDITFCYYTSTSFSYVFQTVRQEMDFYIVPTTFVKENSNFFNYLPIIDKTYLDSYLEKDLEYITLEDHYRGFKVYDHESKNGFFKDYVTYENNSSNEDFYLFFNYKSQNIGKINDSKTDNGLYIIKILINL